MKIATLNIDWARKKNTSQIEKIINHSDFDFLILTESVDLTFKDLPYKYASHHIPENIIYENLNYTKYLQGQKAFRTILYSKIPCKKIHTVTDNKTNLAVEFITDLGEIIIYCTIIGTWFNRKPFVDQELKNTVADCKRLQKINQNLFIVGDLNTSFRSEEKQFSISSKITDSLLALATDLNLTIATSKIDKNIDHILIPQKFQNLIAKSEIFIDKDLVSDHQGVFIQI